MSKLGNKVGPLLKEWAEAREAAEEHREANSKVFNKAARLAGVVGDLETRIKALVKKSTDVKVLEQGTHTVLEAEGYEIRVTRRENIDGMLLYRKMGAKLLKEAANVKVSIPIDEIRRLRAADFFDEELLAEATSYINAVSIKTGSDTGDDE